MKDLIISNIDDAQELEKLFNSNKRKFAQSFSEVYPDIKTRKIADFWKARLDYSNLGETTATGLSRKNLIIFSFIAIVSSILLKLVNHFETDTLNNTLASRLMAPIIIYSIFAYYIFSNSLQKSKYFLHTSVFFLILTLYNLFASTDLTQQSDFLRLFHLPILLWVIYAISTVKFNFKKYDDLMDFVKFNGDLAVMGAMISIAFGIFVGISAGLFSLIEFNFEYFINNYLIYIFLGSAPVLASFLIKSFPKLVGSVAPIIANIFSPIVLLMLISYLLALIASEVDPINNREFLIIFNSMLIGVMALLIFNLSNLKTRKINLIISFLLGITTILVNSVAIYAISFRLNEYGFTPNRIVVLLSNVIIFIHLIWISISLYKVSFKNTDRKVLNKTIAQYLPVYIAYLLFVIFVLPLFN
jgi:hypothetical protein